MGWAQNIITKIYAITFMVVWSSHLRGFNIIAPNHFATFFTTSFVVFLEILTFPYICMQSFIATCAQSISIQVFHLLCTPWRRWNIFPLSGECTNFKRASMHTETKSSKMTQHYNANRELPRIQVIRPCSKKCFSIKHIDTLHNNMQLVTKCSSKNKIVW